jgi:hypothetical protein
LNYFLNVEQTTLSPNTSYSIRRAANYSLAIEYPYEIAKVFPTPAGFTVASRALGFSLYGVEADTDTQIEIKFTTDVINAVRQTNKDAHQLLKKWDLRCGCYDAATSKIDRSVCSKVSVVDNSFKCSCSVGHSPCYMIYKFSLSLTLAIALPIVGAIICIIVAVMIWKLVTRKRSAKDIVTTKTRI